MAQFPGERSWLGMGMGWYRQAVREKFTMEEASM